MVIHLYGWIDSYVLYLLAATIYQVHLFHSVCLVAQPQAGATPDQEATITFLPGGRKRKLMESGMTET